MQQVKGVVARSKGAPVEVVTINVPDPGPGEAVVKVQACGVCHTDLHYRLAITSPPLSSTMPPRAVRTCSRSIQWNERPIVTS